MGIQMSLKQVPPTLLDKMKDNSILVKTVFEAESSPLESLLKEQGYDGSNLDAILQSTPGLSAEQANQIKQFFEETQAAQKQIDEEYGTSNENVESLYLGKSWQSIHFLLTGQTKGGELPLANALMSNNIICEDDEYWGYGPPRYLTASEVKAVAAKLPSLKKLKKKFNPAEMGDAELYSFNKEDAEGEWGYISHYYERMLAYYKEAAQRKYAMLIWAS